MVRKTTDNLASLVKKIDEVVADNKDKKMCAFIVWLTDDPDAQDAAEALAVAAERVAATAAAAVQATAKR